MRLLKKLAMIALAVACAFSFAACGDRGEDGSFNPDGSYKPGAKGTVLRFWGWGDEVEGKVFNKLTEDFNNTIGKASKITVEYNKIPSSDYDTLVIQAMGSPETPDVVYIGDGAVKGWVENGYLASLDEFLDMPSTTIKVDEMWPSGVNRYRYNLETTTSNDDDPLWGLPKDIGPTVIYYNADYLRNAGVTIISVSEEDMKDKFGTQIPGTDGKTYSWRGYDAQQKVFNNQIAMNWEETVELSALIQKDKTPSNKKCEYGFFTEWWFNYGWSVGGDCMEYVPDENGDMYYKFTLGDETKNYIVKDEYTGTVEISGGGSYKAGEIISYVDKTKLTPEQKANCNELPSQREAFTEFCRLSAKTSQTVDTVNGQAIKGHGISMNPATLGDADYSAHFTTGVIGMYVDGRWAVTTHRTYMKEFDWDVAPLPVYRRYNEDGTVQAHGIASGHSGSMAVGIPAGSPYKNAAWLFVQYIAGETGQAAQSKEGFAIPNQMKLAEDEEIFLQTTKKPHNSKIFIDAALNQRAADWTYLKDGIWINKWAPTLNSDVRDGKMSLTKFFADYTKVTQDELYKYNNYRPKN